MKIFVSDKLDAKAVERMRAAGYETVVRTGLQGADLAQALQGFQALVVRGATKVTGEVLRGAPDLRVVARAGTGLDNVDVATAKERGVRVLNTPSANAVSVAELTLGMLIALERHLVPAASDLSRGHWEKTRYMGRELSGRRLGLVGFGRIGREVALRARAFEMQVVAADPFLLEWPVGFEWAVRSTLDELLPEVDVLSLHLPLTSETKGLIGAPELSRMRKDALLIQCARGGIVDETALLEALRGGSLRGAALDVFAIEPPGPNPLLELPQVLATPHLGASTAEAQSRAGMEAADLVIAVLAKL